MYVYMQKQKRLHISENGRKHAWYMQKAKNLENDQNIFILKNLLITSYYLAKLQRVF